MCALTCCCTWSARGGLIWCDLIAVERALNGRGMRLLAGRCSAMHAAHVRFTACLLQPACGLLVHTCRASLLFTTPLPAHNTSHCRRGLQVPGFSRGEVRPYQRQPASAEHQRRMAAVRKAMATSAAGSGAGGAAAGTPAGPPAVGAADKQQQQAGGAGGAGPSTAAAATAEDGGAAAAAAAAANGKSGGGATPAKQQQAQQAGKQAGKQAAAAGTEVEDMPDLDVANGKA